MFEVVLSLNLVALRAPSLCEIEISKSKYDNAAGDTDTVCES
jgi:hypothetical protein